VICNEEDTDGRARVSRDEERVLHYTVSQIKRSHFSFRHNFYSCYATLKIVHGVVKEVCREHAV